MKKYTLLALLLSTNIAASAQNFGLKTGLSVANLTTTESDINLDNDARIGVFFGVVSEFGEDNIRFSTELIFNQKGNKNNIHFNCIDLALKGNFYFNDEICLNIGPSIGYLISGEFDGSNTEGAISWEKIPDDTWSETNNRLDYSACFGISYKMNDLLNIGFSYNVGLSSIFKDDYADLKTNSSNLSVSYLFNY